MNKFLTFLTVGLFLSFGVFAQSEVPQLDSIDQMILVVLSILSSIPVAGPYLAITLKVLGVLSVVLTAASTMLIALAGMLNIAGLTKVSEWIKKILPYIQFASNYNVQKK